MVSPGDLEAHALGFMVTEGLVEPEEVEGIHQEGERIFVKTVGDKKISPSRTSWRSSAYRGREGGSVTEVSSNIKIAPALIVQCAHQVSVQAENWKKTGGMHISLLFDQQGELIETAERLGVTLIGFAREGRFTIYSHPERVRVAFSPEWR